MNMFLIELLLLHVGSKVTVSGITNDKRAFVDFCIIYNYLIADYLVNK